MTSNMGVQEYVANQGRYTWRRRLLRAVIRWLGFSLLAKVETHGLEHIPASGPTIIMMNHLSAIDPIVCMGVIQSRFAIPMTKVENAQNPVLGLLVRFWGAYTVERGTVDRSALQNSIELLKSGQMILIAPEGTRNPEGLGEGRDGLAYIAVRAGAIVLPTAVTGSQGFMKRWKRLRRAQVQVTFGRPFRFDVAEDARLSKDLRADLIREAMYQLAITQPDPALRGVYSDVETATSDHLRFV